MIFKFISTWCIQTPKGFSSLHMHPLGRFDLPFYSFHGIVDTDVFYKNTNIVYKIIKRIIKKVYNMLYTRFMNEFQ